VDGRIVGGLSYATALFERATVQRYLRYWMRLLLDMTLQPRARVSELTLLEPDERRQLLSDFNETGSKMDGRAPLQLAHEVFDARAGQTPDATAVILEQQSLSYAQLSRRSNQLAHHLRRLGVGPEVTVGICTGCSLATVVSLLAVLKAGGAYVPLDTTYPEQWQQYVMGDAGFSVVLTHEDILHQLPATLAKVVCVDRDGELWSTQPQTPPRVTVNPQHLAYVIYTSGSTGRPKGMQLHHAGLSSLLTTQAGPLGMDSHSRILQFASLSFDVATAEILLALTCGATLILARRDSMMPGDALLQTLRSQRITHAVLPPTALAATLPKNLPDLRVVITTGEACTAAIIEQWSGFRLINAYGPTEATVWVTAAELAPGRDAVPIGQPLPNSRIYILDPHGQPVPVGVPGELHIGGVAVGRGYLGRAALTAERFIPDPFGNDEHNRLYKTGDRACWLPDGQVLYLGRLDFQVKIRGFRIELGEIEQQLLTHPLVREAVVLALAGALVAYYRLREPPAQTGTSNSAEPERTLDPEALRAHLVTALPHYMVPAAFVNVREWPSTPNGKLDRRALPPPGDSAYGRKKYEAPRGQMEEQLAQIWSGWLGAQRIGREDNFFELGGHSLLAVRLVGQLQQIGFEATVVDVLLHPTISALARHLTDRRRSYGVEEVMPIRTAGEQRPLFLAHDHYGLHAEFAAIAAHLDESIPVYGLPALPPQHAQPNTMEDLAARLVTALRATQPRGPYRLAGWSFGGALSYEVARQLLAADEAIEFLGLLDSYCPGLLRQIATHQQIDDSPGGHLLSTCAHGASAANAEQLHILAAQSRTQGLSFEELLDECRRMDALPAYLMDHTNTQILQFVERLRAHAHALECYCVDPIPVPIHLFVAQDPLTSEERHASHPLLGWDAVLPSSQLRVIRIPGNHFTLMTEPNVAVLGRALSQALGTASLRA